ncbi:hypothetical protein SAMN05444678_11465 [Sphingomonas sp. YR710]|uniref:hypothetical protein n=1 Tax=Sphingomonas sp. YR710 TaxID=1882773 RepID=UPI00087E41D8|nr:hypothetical protein [Sphingomonas sp. YR710]SDD49810.1 hypothetical protein SAMN05444678_11465 [Sphingomonas sp. YR710]
MIGWIAILAALDAIAIGLAAEGAYRAIFVGVHLFTTLAAIGIIIGKKRSFDRLDAVSALIACSLGPPGCLAFLLFASLTGRWRGRGQVGFDDDDDVENKDTGAVGLGATEALLEGRLPLITAAKVGSLISVLRYGDVNDRMRAVEIAVRSFEPRLSPIVAAALLDSDQTIRALAAAASTQIAKNCDRTRARLERRLQRTGDPASLIQFLSAHGTYNVLLSPTARLQMLADTDALKRSIVS